MISPWEIYWVMQLDAIRCASVVVCVLGGTGLLLAHTMAFDSYDEERSMKRVKCAAPLLLIPMLAATFLPSSKTAAAMIVIPAIANNERFQAEASDLYDLAKQGLKKIVATDEEKAESK